ncbi:MAG: hypothetical protein DIZ77_07280 [endosymbiont of Seepiophila jonesi]|uniref:Uncharacterized protein n=1 Tax=endosymbiont of Lamellibrachia luymesi TaxID=2200907 RepID=A0A370DVJ8_9GAMM|nr:MAG: hypothetical protein DIZ79_14605 [endosymbiont of Lamellibrachia luymesi]RDH92866.1 MAG: hypothetical protein DIZ77_07280 [endosymbiont of Seepiophila jonesi]
MTLCGDEFSVSPGIQAFAGQVEESATTSLDLLRAVDQTVDALSRQQRKLMPNLEMAHWLLGMLERAKVTHEAIDPDGELDRGLERAEIATQSHVEVLKAKQDAAFRDSKLRDHHEEAVVAAYQETIGLASDIFDAVEALRIYIREFDADASGSTGQAFTSAEDIIEALDSE